MRLAYLALGVITGLVNGLILTATSGHALEIEAEKLFSAPAETARIDIISTADLDVFAPAIERFRAANPTISVRYVVTSSAELFRALHKQRAAFDVAISSAMDLQTKLANDGHAQTHRSAATDALPSWASWGGYIFAFTQEPAVALLARDALGADPPPRTRSELIDLMRRRPELFDGRIGAYDPHKSGLGYLFATQDARQSESFWRLAEVMGGLSPKLYCCTAHMIDALAKGELNFVYNALGSYVNARQPLGRDLEVIFFEDYTHIMMRTALIPATARRPELGGRFIDFLVSERLRPWLAAHTGLPPIDPAAISAAPAFRPIRLGPGILVYQDQMKRRSFLDAWSAAVLRP